MSITNIRAALETALNGMSPALSTKWQNMEFTPVVGTPYQRVDLLMAEPLTLSMSQRNWREQGIFQILLCYPLNAGPGTAEARAELIKQTFYAGRSFTASGTTVFVDGTPEVATGMVSEDIGCYTLPVRVKFYAHVTRS